MALIMLDLETDGLDTDTARIVEIALCGLNDTLLHTLVNPGCPIPADATAVHGITDADVRDAPMFASIATKVQGYINGATLVTYNGRSFDVLILDRELREAGQPGIDLDAVAELDAYRVWQAAEPRTLAGALKRFCGIDYEDAHNAASDAHVLYTLVRAMQERLHLSIEQMLDLSHPAEELDRSGKLRRLDDGTVVWNFGKHKGKPVTVDADYCRWVLGADFPADTRRALETILKAADDASAR